LCRYRASLVGFTKSLAREVGRVGVNVNAIAPGFIDAEMTGGLEGSERERVISRSALRRLAAPEDIAAMTAFLMGEGGRNIDDSRRGGRAIGACLAWLTRGAVPALRSALKDAWSRFGSLGGGSPRAGHRHVARVRRRKADLQRAP